MLIDSARVFHAAIIEPSLGPAVGSTRDQIDALQSKIGLPLPQAYCEYLSWMGNDSAGILRGTACFISDTESNQSALVELLSENGLSPPSGASLVFYVHQGYVAHWFDVAATDPDPIVMSFSEAFPDRGIHSIGRFSEWLAIELRSLAKAL